MNQRIFKGLCLFMAATTLNLSTFAAVPLRRGTQVPVRLVDKMDSKKNTTANAIVDNDVKAANGTVVIKAGTPVNVETKANKAGGVGKPGTICLKFASTTAVDGTRIALEGSNVEVEGKNKRGLALGLGLGLGLTIVWPMLFVMCKKGGQAKLDANTTYSNIYTAYDVDINN